MSKTVASTRTYHHGDLRQALIEAACEHLRTSGADTLSRLPIFKQAQQSLWMSSCSVQRHDMNF